MRTRCPWSSAETSRNCRNSSRVCCRFDTGVRALSAGSLGSVTDRDAGAPRRVGIMGGTFDPVHNGHLVAASEVASRFSLDEVVFVPTGQPWQKSHRHVAPARDRYLMPVIAPASNPMFSVSRVDIDRPGETFTIDTLSDLRQ